MATIAELAVRIGADTADLERATRRMQSDINSVGTSISTLASDMDTSTSDMRRQWRNMSTEMRAAAQRNAEALAPFREQQREIQYEFFQMAEGMSEYQGSTREFMDELTALGNRNRQVNDNMIRNNNMARMSFIQGIATMLARSTQSSAIADNFDRMNNPLYRVNNGLLRVSGGLERIAARGQPAALALEMLGPTASMKDLLKMQRMITQGLMRFQMVAMGALVVNALMFAGLHKAAKDSVPGYKQAFEEMGAAVREAFQPMVDVFGAVMKRVYEFITWIANLAISFNEAHPVMAKVIQGFLMLIPILTLILSPLAIGIGLIMGMRAAFASVWMLIAPFVTGLASMMGTVLLVAGAIALVGLALWALWTKTDWFKGAVLKAWDAIKNATLIAWNWIMDNVITPVLTAIQTFIQDKMEQIRTFWAENGQMILEAGRNVWNVIQKVIEVALTVIGAIMQVVWPVVKALVISTWEAIKLAIDGAINFILGIIKFFSALFTGNWSKMWEALKQILKGAVQFLLGFVQLTFIGGLVRGIKGVAITLKTLFKGIWDDAVRLFTSGISKVKSLVSKGFDAVVNFVKGLGKTFYNAGKGLIEMMANGIKNAAGAVLNAVKKLAQKARDFLPFSPAKEGPLSDLDKLDFGGPISDSISKAVPMVKGLMGDLFTVPTFEGNEGSGVSGAQQPVSISMDGMFNGANFVVREEADIRKIAKELYDYTRTQARGKGVVMP
jgi:phage-related protein